MRDIKRLLVANRGEIACRIIQCCQQQGIEAIAIYSDADADARHTRMADRAYYIGPSPAAQSYLNAEAIIHAAVQAQVDAIHPGYGFLSESLALIALCEQNDIRFVGPSQTAIAQMGCKIAAKQMALRLGIPVLPGYNGDDQTPSRLVKEATKIGAPLLIKASAGGGGKGMRIIDDIAHFQAALLSVQEESKRAFGDDRVLLERYLPRSRHIEVQILGDQHGNLVHLYDRECSIQRHYQKIIEEAPASHLSDAKRQQLFNDALTLAEKMAYHSTGTVEFILDADTEDHYFLEMNTRLQVEHPTTEAVTGLDLVALQIQVAAGKPLPFRQDDIAVNGVAIEARITAEDPANQFRPSVGTITAYRPPSHQHLRCDSGVGIGSTLTPYYDNLLSKLIAWGDDRTQATHRLLRGLEQFCLSGLTTNLAFLHALVQRPAFAQPLHTAFIDHQFPDGWRSSIPAHQWALASAYHLATANQRNDEYSPWTQLDGWRLTRAHLPTVSHVTLESGQITKTIEIKRHHHDYRCTVDNDEFQFQLICEERDQCTIQEHNMRYTIHAQNDAMQIQLRSHHGTHLFHHVPFEQHHAPDTKIAPSSRNAVYADLPGAVTALLVTAGDKIVPGTPLLSMEAMKLIHTLTSPIAGEVRSFHVAQGELVHEKQKLISLTPLDSPAHDE